MGGFNQLLEVVASLTCQLEDSAGGLSQAQDVWQELQPSLDLSSLEEQVEQTEATVGAGAVLQQMSSVLKSLLLLFTKQQKGVPCPSLSAAFLTIPLLVSLQNCNKKCSAVQCRTGEVG